MGKHSGDRVEKPPRRHLPTYAGAAAVAALAWIVLVYYAIQLGPDAKAGQLGAWLLLVVATLGAVACLFLALIYCGKLYEALRGDTQPAVAPGGGRRIKQ